MIALKSKVIAVISKILHDAHLPNKVKSEQVGVQWAIVKGEVKYTVNTWCALCGIILALPLLKDTVCGDNFNRHLKRKHAQGKDPLESDQKQTKMEAFFRPVEQAKDTTNVNDEEGASSTSAVSTEAASLQGRI